MPLPQNLAPMPRDIAPMREMPGIAVAAAPKSRTPLPDHSSTPRSASARKVNAPVEMDIGPSTPDASRRPGSRRRTQSDLPEEASGAPAPDVGINIGTGSLRMKVCQACLCVI
jgi:hypothetical protein